MSSHDPLESGQIGDIAKSKARYERLLRFNWKYYSELAFQRAQVYEGLKASLSERTAPFQFSRWQRAVKYKYSLFPLSAKGSLRDPGGRFNIGEIDTARFAAFAALYLASDKATALDELLERRAIQGQPLTDEELALTKSVSLTVVSVSGELESALDVTREENVTGFVNLVNKFHLSSGLAKEARALGLRLPRLVSTTSQMIGELHFPWRAWPMLYDVPSPSQIFGQVAMNAGIEASGTHPF